MTEDRAGFMEFRPVTKLSLLIPGSIGAFIGPSFGEEVVSLLQSYLPY